METNDDSEKIIYRRPFLVLLIVTIIIWTVVFTVAFNI